MKKIYFAGSIRGGRIDAELYGRLIKHMQKDNIVLTEHIGSPHLNLMEQGKRDIDIYNEDTAWLRESDIVIAECTCPSLGVGYEMAYAEKLGKPCHIFYDRSKTQLSAMLTAHGGYVESATVNNQSLQSKNNSYHRTASYTLRIPAEQADAFVAAMGSTLHLTFYHQKQKNLV